MDSTCKSAENFDLASILKELHSFDDGGMAEWFGDEDCVVPAAKKRKVMSDATTSRFGNKVTSDSELKEISKGFVPKKKNREEYNLVLAQFPVLV